VEGRAALARALKEHLGREDRQLREEFLQGGQGGRAYAEARSRSIDAIVAGLWPLFAPPGYRGGLLACGGYGRREMAPHSDVDLTFLVPEKEAPPTELVEGVLYVLWDMGLTAGHATRTPSEALAAATEDLATFTTLLESRLLAGDPAVGDAFKARFLRSVGTRGFQSFLKMRLRERAYRLSPYDGSLFLLEPNLKEGAGGLRDVHLISWLTALKGAASPAAAGLLSLEQEGFLLRDLDFLLSLRVALHLSKDRREDVLDVDSQPQVARMLHFLDRGPRRGVERMMSRYYRTAREVQGLLQLVLERSHKDPRFTFRGFRTLSAGFALTPGGIDLDSKGKQPPWTPRRILELFGLAQKTGAPLRPRLKEAIRSHLFLIDREYRSTAEGGELFLALLNEPSNLFTTLSAMHETGVLGRILPEFGRINALVQHDHYHHYTIDEHSLMAVKAIARLAAATDATALRYAPLLRAFPSRRTLFLVALLHDVGKAQGKGHAQRGAVVGRQVARRLGLTAEEEELLVFLIAGHLEMAHVSQRRDLDDPDVIRAFASIVDDPVRLAGLMLLTFADLSAIGPGVMTEWKESLLWELYAKTHAFLEGEQAEGDRRARLLAQRRDWLLAHTSHGAGVVDAHLQRSQDSYLLLTQPEEMARHLDLLGRLEGELAAFSWRPGPVGGTVQIEVATYDRIGLFALLVGAMTAEKLNILRAALSTRSDGLVVDSFLVEGPTPPHPVRTTRLELLRTLVNRLLSGEVSPEKQFGWPPPLAGVAGGVKVSFDNQASRKATLMEITAPDARGLLHAVARTLAGLSVNIGQAIIATEKNRVHDVFYITDANGSKILFPEGLARIEQEVVAALSGTSGGEG
jgi:[protein-PII] uridylyltransferase